MNYMSGFYCINQRNSEERKQQGQLMKGIYRKAHRAIVWIRKEAVDRKEARESTTLKN
ncbi:hypothetical protein B0O99DRAFT_634026 [Bisporella sp. PMI_857]|nr:hypothetical protein B0O99DRAFT_634026 [Bisporella sp. PMI_857]